MHYEETFSSGDAAIAELLFDNSSDIHVPERITATFTLQDDEQSTIVLKQDKLKTALRPDQLDETGEPIEGATQDGRCLAVMLSAPITIEHETGVYECTEILAEY